MGGQFEEIQQRSEPFVPEVGEMLLIKTAGGSLD